jgi:hypothetical protein
MPFAGAFNHWRFRKTGKKTVLGYVHVWVGRALLVVGLVNGGFGLKLADEGSGGKIAYAVLAAFVALVYGSVLVWWYILGGKSGKTAAEEMAAEVELEASGIQSN